MIILTARFSRNRKVTADLITAKCEIITEEFTRWEGAVKYMHHIADISRVCAPTIDDIKHRDNSYGYFGTEKKTGDRVQFIIKEITNN